MRELNIRSRSMVRGGSYPADWAGAPDPDKEDDFRGALTGFAPEAGQEIVLLPIPSASPAKAGVYRSAARACAHWQGIAILRKSETADPWIPAFPTDLVRGLKAHGKARVAVDDFSLDLDICPASPALPILLASRATRQFNTTAASPIRADRYRKRIRLVEMGAVW
jgi:hypothetical protein